MVFGEVEGVEDAGLEQQGEIHTDRGVIGHNAVAYHRQSADILACDVDSAVKVCTRIELRVQLYQQGVCAAEPPVEFGNVKIFEQLAVVFGIVAEGRGIEHELFAGAFRVLSVEFASQLV